MLQKALVFLTSGLLSLMATSCYSANDAEKKALAHLESKYGIPFEVVSSTSVSMVHRYDVTAQPINNPSLSHTVSVRDSGGISDFYVEAKYRQEATAYLKDVIDRFQLSFPFVVTVNPRSDIGHLNFKNLPEWKTQFFDKPHEHRLSIKINFFTEPNDEAMTAIRMLDKQFRTMKPNRLSFVINFFDKTALNGQPVNSFQYGYGTDNQYFEGQKRDYFRGRLSYHASPKQEKTPSKQQLLDHIKFKFLSSRFSVL